jgi:hypothetical protein
MAFDFKTASPQELVAKWAQVAPAYERDYGIVLPEVRSFLPTAYRRNSQLAMDAQPTLTTTPDSGIPWSLTNFFDPDHLQILFAPLQAAKIIGEKKKGDWTMLTAAFPTIERTGDTSSYGDYSDSGSSGANVQWPYRQSYFYQTIIQYGERELAMMALAQLDWVAEKRGGAITALDQFQNNMYFFGVAGLQNYGIINDPNLLSPIQPGPKAYNAQAHGPWITNGVITATANEIYNDFLSQFLQLVAQGDGQIAIDRQSELVWAMAPQSEVALAQVNAPYNSTTVFEIIKKEFPNLRIETAVQYGTSLNNLGGNLTQLIATKAGGQDYGYCAFTERLRSHPIIRKMSAFEQKMSQGGWGAVNRQPWASVFMLGV